MEKTGLIEEFETSQCIVSVYDTGWCVDYYHIYCIKSYHKKTQETLTRFGTEEQIKQILKTYQIKKEKKFSL